MSAAERQTTDYIKCVTHLIVGWPFVATNTSMATSIATVWARGTRLEEDEKFRHNAAREPDDVTKRPWLEHWIDRQGGN